MGFFGSHWGKHWVHGLFIVGGAGSNQFGRRPKRKYTYQILPESLVFTVHFRLTKTIREKISLVPLQLSASRQLQVTVNARLRIDRPESSPSTISLRVDRKQNTAFNTKLVVIKKETSIFTISYRLYDIEKITELLALYEALE